MQADKATTSNAEYFSQRNLHPRTGDCAAFMGRDAGDDVSPRSNLHDDLLADSPFHTVSEGQGVPTDANVELEGVTADGGLALNVGFDNTDHSELLPDEKPAGFEQVANLSRRCLSKCRSITAAITWQHRAHL